MSERKFNAALYVLLVAAVLLYLDFNVFNVMPVFVLPEESNAQGVDPNGDSDSPENVLKEDINLSERVQKEDVSSIELEVQTLEDHQQGHLG